MKTLFTLAVVVLCAAGPAFAESYIAAPDSAEFYEYMVTAIRIRGPLKISEEIELKPGIGPVRAATIVKTPAQKIKSADLASTLPRCQLWVRSDVKVLRSSKQIYTFQDSYGEGSSSFGVIHDTKNSDQLVQRIACGFWTGKPAGQNFTLGMLKKTLGTSVEIVGAVQAASKRDAPFRLIPLTK